MKLTSPDWTESPERSEDLKRKRDRTQPINHRFCASSEDKS